MLDVMVAGDSCPYWVLVMGAGDGCWCWVPVAGPAHPSPSPPLFLGCTAQAEGAKEATPSPGSSQSETELQEGGGANVDGKETPHPGPQTWQRDPTSPYPHQG